MSRTAAFRLKLKPFRYYILQQSTINVMINVIHYSPSPLSRVRARAHTHTHTQKREVIKFRIFNFSHYMAETHLQGQPVPQL